MTLNIKNSMKLREDSFDRTYIGNDFFVRIKYVGRVGFMCIRNVVTGVLPVRCPTATDEFVLLDSVSIRIRVLEFLLLHPFSPRLIDLDFNCGYYLCFRHSPIL